MTRYCHLKRLNEFFADGIFFGLVTEVSLKTLYLEKKIYALKLKQKIAHE